MKRFTAHSTHSQHQVFDNVKRWTAKWCDSSEEAQRVAAEMNRAESEHEKQDNSILTHVERKVEKVGGVGI